MFKKLTYKSWKDKISNVAQVGGIETAVLDKGPARGTRIAWVNTGTGLRYKIVLDRAMDIADAFWGPYCLSWLSPLGITPPEPFSDKGADWLYTFGGGLMVTCGLTHTGGPETDTDGSRGLHGRISNRPAVIESILQPDPQLGQLKMSITGIIKETTIFGPDLELRRTISGELGKPIIQIHDEVLNRGNTAVPHMLLYHCNFGWPLVDEGTEIRWKGKWKPRDEESRFIFKEGNDFHRCPKPLERHKGTGEAAAFIDAESDKDGICSCGIYNERLDLQLDLRFKKAELPWLTNWQHWGRSEYVTGLEPGTHPPIGQNKAKERGTLIYLEPGEIKHYNLDFEINQRL